MVVKNPMSVWLFFISTSSLSLRNFLVGFLVCVLLWNSLGHFSLRCLIDLYFWDILVITYTNISISQYLSSGRISTNVGNSTYIFEIYISLICFISSSFLIPSMKITTLHLPEYDFLCVIHFALWNIWSLPSTFYICPIQTVLWECVCVCVTQRERHDN